MAVPDEYVAVWRRASIALDDAPASEFQHVTWIQSGELYCDLRVPLGQLVDAEPGDAISFAGDCLSNPPRLRWTHEQELEREPGPDSIAGVDEGEVWWEGADLIERGEFEGPDGPIVYTEVWCREDVGAGDLLALASVDGTSRMVVLGDHALVVMDERGVDAQAPVGAYRARYQRRVSGRWETVTSLGPVDDLADPPAIERNVAAGSALEWAGRAWTVIESRPTPVQTAPVQTVPVQTAPARAVPS